MSALLLLGPTGSGKTPLGDLLAARGLWGRRCVHFDFGACLRAAAAGAPVGLEATELAVVRAALAHNALLEDRHFAIAEKLLARFAAAQAVDVVDWIVLNGLPRHVGQAEALVNIAAVSMVVYLDCAAAEVSARIRLDAGGDRGGRVDDDAAAVAGKLRLFEQRTTLLLQHYQAASVPVLRVPVTRDTRPAHVWARLQTQAGTGPAAALRPGTAS